MDDVVKTIGELKSSVDKLQCEVVDVVNNVVNLSKQKESDDKELGKNCQKSQSEQPLFRNPQDIPDYDSIEVIEVAQMHDNPSNDSVVSTDDLVPDFDDTNDLRRPLNCKVQTIQL